MDMKAGGRQDAAPVTDKLEVPPEGDLSKTYQVTVLIVMPTSHPHSGDRWDDLGEYSIGTLELTTTTTLDNSIHR